jgi:predicted DNA binding CopG/RHH family protein
MKKSNKLDALEKDIEDNFQSLTDISNMAAEIDKFKDGAFLHIKRKKSITLRVHESDLEMMRLKACRLGIPYQTYINMLIHKDASMTN